MDGLAYFAIAIVASSLVGMVVGYLAEPLVFAWLRVKRRTIHVADAALAARYPSGGLPTFSDDQHRRVCAILNDAGIEYTVEEDA